MHTILLNAVHRVVEAENQDGLMALDKEAIDISSQSTDSGNSSQATVIAPEVAQHYPQLTPKILSSIISLAAGDARSAITFLDLVLSSPKDRSETSLLMALRKSASVAYDRTGDSHYDMISALHKSVRGSQPHAALYWLARMLAGGEDPLYIARRMVPKFSLLFSQVLTRLTGGMR
jgi:putative ATPase